MCCDANICSDPGAGSRAGPIHVFVKCKDWTAAGGGPEWWSFNAKLLGLMRLDSLRGVYQARHFPY